MSVCKANDVRAELMNPSYLPQDNEACFIPIALQIEKLTMLQEKKRKERKKIIRKDLRKFVKNSIEDKRSSKIHVP